MEKIVQKYAKNGKILKIFGYNDARAKTFGRRAIPNQIFGKHPACSLMQLGEKVLL